MATKSKAVKETASVPSSRFSKCAEFLCGLGFKTVVRTSNCVEYLNVYLNGTKQGYMAFDPARELNSFYVQPAIKVLYELYNASRRNA